MFLVSSWSCPCPIHWSQWRCSWSSADRWCSNYFSMINDFIAYWGAAYIRDFTVLWCAHPAGIDPVWCGPVYISNRGWMPLTLLNIHYNCHCWIFITAAIDGSSNEYSTMAVVNKTWSNICMEWHVARYRPPNTSWNLYIETARVPSIVALYWCIMNSHTLCHLITWYLEVPLSLSGIIWAS